MEIERALDLVRNMRFNEGSYAEEAVAAITIGYLDLRNEKDKIVADLEGYAEHLHHEELLSETGQWIANRVVLECIKIVKKEKENTK